MGLAVILLRRGHAAIYRPPGAKAAILRKTLRSLVRAAHGRPSFFRGFPNHYRKNDGFPSPASTPLPTPPFCFFCYKLRYGYGYGYGYGADDAVLLLAKGHVHEHIDIRERADNILAPQQHPHVLRRPADIVQARDAEGAVRCIADLVVVRRLDKLLDGPPDRPQLCDICAERAEPLEGEERRLDEFAGRLAFGGFLEPAGVERPAGRTRGVSEGWSTDRLRLSRLLLLLTV